MVDSERSNPCSSERNACISSQYAKGFAFKYSTRCWPLTESPEGLTTMISSSTSLGLPLVASLMGLVEPWTRIFCLYRATVTTVQPTRHGFESSRVQVQLELDVFESSFQNHGLGLDSDSTRLASPL